MQRSIVRLVGRVAKQFVPKRSGTRQEFRPSRRTENPTETLDEFRYEISLIVARLVALSLFAALAFTAKPSAAQEPRPPVAKLDLQDGDSIVFLGDSITHQRLYTQYVEDFFYTRYPSMRFKTHNAGVGGREGVGRAGTV